MARSIHLRFSKLPSGLACYPRVVLTRRQPLAEVGEPPEFHARVERVLNMSFGMLGINSAVVVERYRG